MRRHRAASRRHAHDEGNGGAGHDHMHFECCEQVFHGREPFLEHREAEHPGEPFRCGCGEEFDELDEWLEHAQAEHG